MSPWTTLPASLADSIPRTSKPPHAKGAPVKLSGQSDPAIVAQRR
jgi:hypothetical protein